MFYVWNRAGKTELQSRISETKFVGKHQVKDQASDIVIGGGYDDDEAGNWANWMMDVS
jgi:hypothetical protein